MSNLIDSIEQPLTYENYMSEGEINLRYDIIDGVRHFMTNPTRIHQRILFRLANLLEHYAVSGNSGSMQIAPCDILIRRFPLRTRQPDVLFMSDECAALNPPLDDPAPLDPAPELVIEIISPTETVGTLYGKLSDYQRVNVRECWIVKPSTRTVEVVAISQGDIETLDVYAESAQVESRVFPGLKIAVSDIFAG